MSDLTDFLLARIADDEEWADRVEFRPYVGEGVPASLRERVLAECEAKRRIVRLHECVDDTAAYSGVPLYCNPCQTVDGYGCESIGDRGIWPCDTIKALALPYADHPDWREEWRP